MDNYIFPEQMVLNDSIKSKDINLYQAEIDIEEVTTNGLPVEHNGQLVAFYYPDKFNVYNCYIPKKIDYDKAQTIFNTVASNVTFLNRHLSIDDLMEYLRLLADRYIAENDGLVISMEYLKWWVIKVRKEEVDPYPELKSYYWVGEYRYASRAFKLEVTRSYNGSVKRMESVSLVNRAIDTLQEKGEYFLTAKIIAEESGLHINTVYDILNVNEFKNDINEYNLKKFKTTIYSSHRKNTSIDRIVQAIDSYVFFRNSSLSKVGVAKKAKLHYQTVGNLWGEDLVVAAYDRYNEWVYNFKQIA